MATLDLLSAKPDIFLRLELAKSGLVKGEASGEHADEVLLTGWSWGMQARTSMGTGGTAGKASLQEIQFAKIVDKATPILMTALRNNDVVRQAVLTMRKSGNPPHEFFVMTVKQGRLTELQIGVSQDGILPTETWTLSFREIEVNYRPQDDANSLGGSATFTDVLS